MDPEGAARQHGRMPALSIEIVSDVVCPWCFIGHARLMRALSGRPDVTASIRFTPFLLDPATPPEGADLRERLRTKYGVAPEAMFARVEAAAKESGVTLDFGKITRAPSTLGAHVLLDHAHERGTQLALADALFRAYFQDGIDIGDPARLSEIASAHGFTEGEARTLALDAAERARVREIAMTQVARGVSGVPFFVVAGRYAVPGAQDEATWARLLDRVAPRPAVASA